MPRKRLVDLTKLRNEIKNKSEFVHDARGSVHPDNPAVERLDGMRTAYTNILDYLKECQKYDSQGRKI